MLHYREKCTSVVIRQTHNFLSSRANFSGEILIKFIMENMFATKSMFFFAFFLSLLRHFFEYLVMVSYPFFPCDASGNQCHIEIVWLSSFRFESNNALNMWFYGTAHTTSARRTSRKTFRNVERHLRAREKEQKKQRRKEFAKSNMCTR